MARLTYQNVNAPNWNITGGLALANATLGNALKGFSDSLGDLEKLIKLMLMLFFEKGCLD